jgi:hypothetical protein
MEDKQLESKILTVRRKTRKEDGWMDLSEILRDYIKWTKVIIYFVIIMRIFRAP